MNSMYRQRTTFAGGVTRDECWEYMPSRKVADRLPTGTVFSAQRRAEGVGSLGKSVTAGHGAGSVCTSAAALDLMVSASLACS